jgi:hypothetical protein
MEGDVYDIEIRFCTQRGFCVDVLDRESSMKISVRNYGSGLSWPDMIVGLWPGKNS